MAAPVSETSRPGFQVGPTSEFSLFFRVKPGEGAEPARRRFESCRTRPGYRPGDYGMAIATIHEARFVLFDDDTRLLVRHELRRPVGRLHGGLLHVGADAGALRRDLPARRGLRRPAGPRGGEGVHPRRARRRPPPTRATTAAPSRRSARRSGSTTRSSACSTTRGRPRRCSTRRWSRCSKRPPTRPAGERREQRRCPTTSRGRAPWPSRSRTSPTSTRSRARSGPGTSCSSSTRCPFAQPSDALLRRARLPLPAAAADARARRRRSRRPRARTRSSSTASSRPPASADGAGQEGTCTTPAGGVGHLPRERRAGRRQRTASAPSPARAGIRSSWTRRPR